MIWLFPSKGIMMTRYFGNFSLNSSRILDFCSIQSVDFFTKATTACKSELLKFPLITRLNQTPHPFQRDKPQQLFNSLSIVSTIYPHIILYTDNYINNNYNKNYNTTASPPPLQSIPVNLPAETSFKEPQTTKATLTFQFCYYYIQRLLLLWLLLLLLVTEYTKSAYAVLFKYVTYLHRVLWIKTITSQFCQSMSSKIG